MMTFIAIIHIFVAVVLIILVLIQDSKGGGALGIGGGSQSVLGATGAQTLASKMTAGAAIVFAITCVALTMLTAQQTKSVLDSAPITTSIPAPETAPAAAAAGTAAPTTESAPATTTPAQQPGK